MKVLNPLQKKNGLALAFKKAVPAAQLQAC